MPGIREAAIELAGRARAPDPSPAVYLPLSGHSPTRPLAATPDPCAAIDGSHAVLVDNGSLWVVAFRVVCVAWPGPPVLGPEPTIETTTPAEAQARLDEAYSKWGLEAPPARSAESFAEGSRALLEAQLAAQRIQSLPPGALLLVDGALRGLPPAAQALADRIQDAARRAGVAAVAVAKRSALENGGVPLVEALQRTGPPGTWAAAVQDGVFVARLHPAARHAFRIDAEDAATVARLLPYCRDAVYTGYPYPLAMAHNAVAITASVKADLKERLQQEVRRAGGARAAALVADFHDVLDRNV